MYAAPGNSTFRIAATFGIPCECLIIDVFMHKSMSDYMQLKPQLFLGDSVAYMQDRALQLPCSDRVQRLGSAPPRMGYAPYSKHEENTLQIFSEAGLSPQDYFGLRYESEYPPSPSTVILGGTLPTRPE